ncbi:ETX/MTX2 family pore-forming toxin [Microbacterium sp. 2FI]|uniref:ETX/MTX2 family pore-forming toxin n=1 Tax=Microbacterium sp. 2FI TaxID=2502193 RepID=UPI0010F49780|nr:ETX/MTX2 family pore-forming toxin [Microbacterium sp. 2FI]
MSEIDVNGKILSALETSYKKTGDQWSVNARPVTQFDTSKVLLRLISLDYPGLADRLIHNPVLLEQTDVKNPTPASVKRTITYSTSVTDSYEWNVTAGLKLTASAKFSAGLPLVGEGEVSTSAELSFAAGYKNTHSETVSFGGSVEVQVPGQTSVSIKTLLAQGKVDAVPFKAVLQAYGQVGAYTAFGGGQGGLSNFSWQWSDLDTGIGWTNPNFKSFPALKDESVRMFEVSGLFTATCGYNVNVVVDPLAAL